MKFPIVASLILLVVMLSLRLKTVSRLTAEDEKNFMNREREANSVRKKPLTDLPYIHVDFDRLPISASSNPEIIEQEALLRNLAEKQIVNLSGYTNTELKLAYGAPNIQVLTEYDQNFTDLEVALSSYGAMLQKEGLEKEAATVYEYLADLGSDIAQVYENLAMLYVSFEEPEKIAPLRDKVSALRTPSKDRILKHLDAINPLTLLQGLS